MPLFSNIMGWFGRSGAIGQKGGQQSPVPSAPLVSDSAILGVDGALQISTVWACIDRRASTIASLPFFAYLQADGQKTLARGSRLYVLLHDSPNAVMTPMEFWRAMVMNHDLRGNAYARIDRDQQTGEALALWPMPADQVTAFVLPDGELAYQYVIDSNVAILAAENVLHLKGLGNGVTGLAKMEFMRATLDESAKAQASASRIFGNGGKPSGVLMVDNVLKSEQREALRSRFADMASGPLSRLYVLEASMKYQQLSLSPEDLQLLDTRKFSVQEICRWFDVPPVLVHHGEGITYQGASAVMESWYKAAVRPMLVSIEQAVRKRVMTPRQRATMSVEYSFDALLRGDSAARAAFYSTALQNGYMTRNEVRQLENLPADPGEGANLLTAQVNLVPLDRMGEEPESPPAAAGSNSS